MKAELVFGKQPPQPKCKHCNRPRDQHLSKTAACPVGRKHRVMGFTSFHAEKCFAPKEPA